MRSILPLVLVGVPLVGGCLFDADYRGSYRCADGRCPSGLTCELASHTCVAALPDDAATPDARLAALTCADPGTLPAAGGAAEGSTTDRTSMIAAMCGGFIMNGADAVYRFDATAGTDLRIEITNLAAYVLTACPATGAPTCVGNDFATAGDPIVVTPSTSTPHFLIVDDPTAGTTGEYAVTITPL